MDEIIFSDYGIEIIKRSGKTFMKYDSGEHCSKIVEMEITNEEEEKARLGEKAAYEVIIAIQNRK